MKERITMELRDPLKDSKVRHIRWLDEAIVFLDQRGLPEEEVYVTCKSYREVAHCIKSMLIRGAPLIGIAAAFGVALAALEAKDKNKNPSKFLPKAKMELAATRPTAVNLFWALDRMEKKWTELKGASPNEIYSELLAEAFAIWNEDVSANKLMGRHGSALITDGATVLTHCNAGALATGGYGTAVGVIRAAVERRKKIKVMVDETRPYLQGARLTAWELYKDGIDVTVITDSMAAYFMGRGEISCVITGSDRIVRNGDAANKIGTYGLAVLAKYHDIPFYIAAPLSTFDFKTESGKKIPIEERASVEVEMCGKTRIVPKGVKARHPAFDVTKAELISAIICEHGVFKPPYKESLKKLEKIARR